MNPLEKKLLNSKTGVIGNSTFQVRVNHLSLINICQGTNTYADCMQHSGRNWHIHLLAKQYPVTYSIQTRKQYEARNRLYQYNERAIKEMLNLVFVVNFFLAFWVIFLDFD